MKTYNVNDIANIPMMMGAMTESANESRKNQAFTVYNTLDQLGIRFDAALYKKVAKHFVNSDKAVMMAFAEYQAKNAEPAALDPFDEKLREIAAANPDNRTKAMKDIFTYCLNNGVTDARGMRKHAEAALNYHNTGRIYNTWREWDNARIAAIKAEKAAARKAKRAAKAKAKAQTTEPAAPTIASTEPKAECVHISFRDPQPQSRCF